MRVLLKILSIFLALIPLFHFSQFSKDPKLDSLCNVWNNNNNTDTIRLMALSEVIWSEYLFSQPDSAYHYAKIMQNYADRCNKKRHLANALNYQGIAFQIKGLFCRR